MMNQSVNPIVPQTSLDLIRAEVEKVVALAKTSLNEAKRVAVTEAWKVLQLSTANVIQIIETFGGDLNGSQKKELAMSLLSKLYDAVFVVIDVPFVPNILESWVHKYIKTFLMMLVSSTIDALVTTFRSTGVFLKSK